MKQENDGKKQEMLRVAAYIRVSTENENQEDSYEAQGKYFSELLQTHAGWVSAGVYADYGLSAVSLRKRNGLIRILRHCRAGRIDRIVCKSVSRFARNTRDFILLMRELEDCGVTIAFEKEGMDTADGCSEFIMTAIAALAQEESSQISGSIRWSNERRFPRGEVRNFAIYGYRYATGNESVETMESGYRLRRLEIVEQEAEVVRRIFREAAQGKTYADIARDLNREQVPPPNAVQNGWRAKYISQIVCHERYAGQVLTQKTYKTDCLSEKVNRNEGALPQYVINGHHPAIISTELFEEVQKVVDFHKKEKRGTKKTWYPFSKRLVCQCCGRYYHATNLNGNMRIWRCATVLENNGKERCLSERIYESELVEMFRRAFRERFTLLSRTPAVQDFTSGSVPIRVHNKRNSCVEEIIEKMELLQNLDSIEQDRAFLMQKKLTAEEGYREAGESSGGNVVKMETHLNYLEQYWKELEEDYAVRNDALHWLKNLPKGEEGMKELLEDMPIEYVKAFCISITVFSPSYCKVRWFDDVETEVVLSLKAV